MNLKIITLLMTFWAFVAPLWADEYPSISPTVTYTDAEGEMTTDNSFSGSAPVKAAFQANAQNTAGWTTYYEWRVYRDNDTDPYIIRYIEDTDFEFTQSGLHRIVLYAKFTKGEDVIEDTNEEEPFTVTISESNLQMPNAFSPNEIGRAHV